jgi:transcriptional regulator with XRE-family HTH domain
MRHARRPDAYDLAVGLRVRTLRIARRMSQAELGERLGITFQQVQKYEKGSNRIGAGRLQHIAEIFDVPIATLFGSPQLGLRGAVDPLEALRAAGAVQLLEAYGRIRGTLIRRAFVRFAEQVAVTSQRVRGRG